MAEYVQDHCSKHERTRNLESSTAALIGGFLLGSRDPWTL